MSVLTNDPYFSITSYDSSSVTIDVYNSGGRYLRYWCELNDGTKVYDSDDYGRNTNAHKVITGLQSGTEYWVRVYSSQTASGELSYVWSDRNDTWASFTTEGQSPLGGGGCMLYLYGWQHAKPYICIGGSWRPATPYIYLHGSWQRCT